MVVEVVICGDAGIPATAMMTIVVVVDVSLAVVVNPVAVVAPPTVAGPCT